MNVVCLNGYAIRMQLWKHQGGATGSLRVVNRQKWHLAGLS